MEAPPPGIGCDLPEGALGTDRDRGDGVIVHSLTAHALREMERHKWIESQKVGYDVGTRTYDEWLDRYWKGWARSKLLEHLYGWRCWGAFGDDQFGLFRRSTLEHHVKPDVLRRVSEILCAGGENLDVIDWAIAEAQDLDAILWLLGWVDINAHRNRLLTAHIRLFL